jgi:hypothetical protein
MSTSFRCLSVGVLAIAISIAGAARGQDLMITGVLDGTLSLNGGGSPKVIELYAINAIPNLSLYALSRAPNGNPTFDVFAAENVLPNIALNAGDFYYAVGNSFQSMLEAFDAVFPEKSAKRVWNYGVNSNGDDATALFFNATGEFVGNDANATLIDVVGNPGEDGTGTPWDHIDSWLYSKDGRAPSATFNVSNWNVGGIDILDLKTAEEIAASFPDETFVVGGGPTFSPADFDEDGFVDADDLAAWQAAYGSTDAGDTNNDGVSDGADFLIWQQEFTGAAPPISAVPEPATLGVGLAGALSVALVGRRRKGR